MSRLLLLVGLIAGVGLGAPPALCQDAPPEEISPFTEVLAVGLTVEDDVPVILAVAKESPAAKAGLLVGDRILKVRVAPLEGLALQNGGWQHGSGGRNMLGYTHLTAVTITAMNGLLMAKQVEIKVDRAVLKRGFGYLRKATSDGQVGYAVGNRGSFSAGRNAGALQCLFRGGNGEDELVAPVLAKLLANIDKAGTGHGSPIWRLFYISLATANLSPDGRERFISLYQKRLLRNQQADDALRAFDPSGSPPGQGEENRVWGALYTTPLIALALLAPYRQDLLICDFDQ